MCRNIRVRGCTGSRVLRDWVRAGPAPGDSQPARLLQLSCVCPFPVPLAILRVSAGSLVSLGSADLRLSVSVQAVTCQCCPCNAFCRPKVWRSSAGSEVTRMFRGHPQVQRSSTPLLSWPDEASRPYLRPVCVTEQLLRRCRRLRRPSNTSIRRLVILSATHHHCHHPLCSAPPSSLLKDVPQLASSPASLLPSQTPAPLLSFYAVPSRRIHRKLASHTFGSSDQAIGTVQGISRGCDWLALIGCGVAPHQN